MLALSPQGQTSKGQCTLNMYFPSETQHHLCASV